VNKFGGAKKMQEILNSKENLASLYRGSVHRAPKLQQTTCKNIVIIRNLCTQNTALIEMRNTKQKQH
jgi:abortive infection bacteriophage resistance protein